jgi:NADH-quinone oxidoreductase subunit L
VDRKIIDAAVNDAGDAARQVSDEVRHMQSGNIRSYAGWIAAGSAAVIAFMIWMGMEGR